VQQVLNHVVENATKFTRDGRISVTVERGPGTAGEDILVVVRDTGVGIAPDIVPTVFETFGAADASNSNKSGGPGLGLAISQKLCRLMGGEISVESKLGVGSCFTVRLPTSPPPCSPTLPSTAVGPEPSAFCPARTLAQAA
jgi:two-component system, sensor histidine kinase